MNTATHHVGAENKINNVDHWTCSANGCPNCYYSVTDNEQFIGVPGVSYPWTWDGAAICSIVGGFFGSGGGGSIPGCVAPSSETTAVAGTTGTTVTEFNQGFGDSAADSFDGSMVQEGVASPGRDTCWFNGSKYLAFTQVSGGNWTVAAGDVAGQHNHWGFDLVGHLAGAVPYYRIQAPLHGKPLPCGWAVYQSMEIKCSSGAWVTYTPPVGNNITSTIEQNDVMNCRNDMSNSACQTINY